MKICAVRGKNLASIAGPFEIDFASEPLASEGVFAITGPTGAGKSTLLDAICLALYNNSPRMARAGVGKTQIDASGDPISGQDPRNILRRGASECYAEVDFVGVDRSLYRSRWMVRRAKGRANGRLQEVDMALYALPSEAPVSGGKQTEVREEIRKRVGLTFEQFTRSVLLAQNEFSTFLRANDDERAALLEVMTRTDLFSSLSVKAFHRAKDEGDALKLLERQRESIVLLQPEVRVELETERARSAEDVAQWTSKLEEFAAHKQWRAEHARLSHAVETASIGLVETTSRWELAASRRENLERVEAVQAVRTTVETVDRLTALVARLGTEGDCLRVQEPSLRGKLSETQEAVQVAERVHECALRAIEDTRPLLVRARDLDSQLSAVCPLHEESFRALTITQASLDSLQKEILQEQVRLSTARSEHAELAAWLSNHEGSRRLAEGWESCERMLGEALRARSGVDEIRANLVSLQSQIDARKNAKERVEGERSLALASLESGRAQLEMLSEEWAALQHSVQEGAELRRRVQRQVEGLRRLEVELDRRRSLEGELLGLVGDELSANRQIASLCTQVGQKQESLVLLQARLAQAKRSLEIAQRAHGLEAVTMREHLVDGTACPVCGSLTHPYAHRETFVDSQAVKELSDELRLVESLETKTRAECNDSLVLLETQRALLLTLGARRGAVESQRAESLERWGACASDAGLNALDPLDADSERVVSDELVRVQAQLTRISEDEDRFHQVTTKREELRRQLELLERRVELGGQKLMDAERELDRFVAELGQQNFRLGEQQEALTKSLADSSMFLKDDSWRALWESDGEKLVNSLRAQVFDWRARLARSEVAGKMVQQVEASIVVLESRRDAILSHLVSAEKSFAALSSRRKALEDARKGVLDGRVVAEVEQELRQVEEASQREMRDSQERLTSARTAMEQWTAGFTMNEEQRRKHEVELKEAHEGVARWLETADALGPERDHAMVRALLGRSSAWIAEERSALNALDQAVKTAGAIREQRVNDLAQHCSARGPWGPDETLDALAIDAEASLAQAVERNHALSLELRTDDTAQREAKRLDVSLDATRAKCSVWVALSDLIGSASGNKFRNFAQQFTLDTLLGYANYHLATVARRYQLKRIPQTLSLSVIDNDMGMEARSVHSLSGGESFLVSLGLALGLASLSSNTLSIESLFIDEGFSSLDVDSLRTALDALDALQAMGRKVGIISHMADLTDRIGTRVEVKALSSGLSEVCVR